MLSNLLLIERTDTNVSRDKQFSVFTVCIYDSFLSHCKIDKSKRADLKVRTCCLIYLKTTEPCIKEQSEIMISNGLVNSFMHIMYSTMLCFISCTLWSAPQEFRLCIVSCVIPTLQQFACPHHILLFKGLELVRFLNVLKEVCIYSALLHSPKNEHHLLTLMSFPNLYKFISYVEHKRRYFTEIHHRRHFFILRVTEFKRFCVTGMTLLSSLVRSSGPVAWGLPLADGTLRSHPELWQPTLSLRLLWNGMTCPFSSLFTIPNTHDHPVSGQSFSTAQYCTPAREYRLFAH